jgi:dTMP kinase
MFVSFEGLDGSGKTTQVERLRRRLETEGRVVVTAREPGGTQLGEQIRALVLHGHEMTAWAEALLYAAARAELVADVAAPALERGEDVILDRYVDSSVAYQGVGRGLGLEEVLELNLQAVGGVLPDRTFVLEVDTRLSGSRVGSGPDRIERESHDFHARVAAGYRRLAELYPERVVLLDGTLPADELASRVHDELRRPA